jgi:hypothetical protein
MGLIESERAIPEVRNKPKEKHRLKPKEPAVDRASDDEDKPEDVEPKAEPTAEDDIVEPHGSPSWSVANKSDTSLAQLPPSIITPKPAAPPKPKATSKATSVGCKSTKK